MELPKPHLAPPPPPLEEIEEEQEHESQQQLSDHTVANCETNQSALIDENKLCLNNYFGIEIAECDDTTTSPGTGMEYSTTAEMKSVPKPHVSPQFDIDTMDTQQDDEETPEMFQASGDSGEPEKAASPITNTAQPGEMENQMQ